MSIDWQHFTPWTALAGGMLIGLSAGLLYGLTRQVAGISGIFHSLVRSATTGFAPDSAWRLAFLAGLLLAPWLQLSIAGTATDTQQSALAPLLIAGVLTGYGTWTAHGCTSGHGICGLSRLSLRSLVAVMCFMFTGMLTVTLVRHLLPGRLP